MAEFTVTISGNGTITVAGTLRHANEVDAFVAALSYAKRAVPSDDREFDEFRSALATDGQKLQAIKLARSIAAIGLKEAKDLVEEIAAGSRAVPADRGDLCRMAGVAISYPSAA